MKAIAQVKSIEDLKKLGAIDRISQDINEKISPLKVSAASYEELFDLVTYLQKNWLPFRQGYFLSKRMEYIYYLLEHDGEKREKLLGINDKIYANPKDAKRWYKKIAQIIRADLADCDEARNAFHKLNEIYEDLTEENAFGDNDV